VSLGRSIHDDTKMADHSSFRIHGFIVGDLEKKHSEYFYSTIPKALGNGEIKFAEVKYDGLDKAPQAMIDLLAGKQGGGEGLGKVVIEIK
jgi:NADPH-dependent curcumin reductase CurA